jgi:hypothetical protein
VSNETENHNDWCVALDFGEGSGLFQDAITAFASTDKTKDEHKKSQSLQPTGGLRYQCG